MVYINARATFIWWEKAANQGHLDAQFSVGLMCSKGLGVAKDDAKAVEWWKKAANQGHAIAKTKLSEIRANA